MFAFRGERGGDEGGRSGALSTSDLMACAPRFHAIISFFNGTQRLLPSRVSSCDRNVRHHLGLGRLFSPEHPKEARFGSELLLQTHFPSRWVGGLLPGSPSGLHCAAAPRQQASPSPLAIHVICTRIFLPTEEFSCLCPQRFRSQEMVSEAGGKTLMHARDSVC